MTNVLLVDDNQNNRMTLELILEDFEDITIQEAEDGAQALEICKKEYFDLIFMDIMMPVMDGIEATEEIKKISPRSMIIALSALDDKDSKHTMLQKGAEDYLTKPIDSELFTQRTTNYLKIISLRSSKIENENAQNPFTTSVYDRQLTFFIKSEESLVQFWDYYLQNNVYHCEDLSDYVRIIYGFSLWLIRNENHFTIIMEENESKIYLMIRAIDSIPKKVVQNIIQKHLNESIFMLIDDTLTFELSKMDTQNESIYVSDETKNILSKTHNEDLTAVEYVETTAISIMPKIESLEEIETALDEAVIDLENTPNKDTLGVVIQRFKAYHEVLELLVQFEHLSHGVNSLIEFLERIDEEKFANDNFNMFITMILHLINDLSSWRETIFIKQDAINVHYLDASLISSCLQIEALFEEKEVEEGDDLEFF